MARIQQRLDLLDQRLDNIDSMVTAVAERIRDSGVKVVAVCFLHSYVNPTHERRVREMLNELLRLPEFPAEMEICEPGLGVTMRLPTSVV